jgi:hypothetical protein
VLKLSGVVLYDDDPFAGGTGVTVDILGIPRLPLGLFVVEPFDSVDR